MHLNQIPQISLILDKNVLQLPMLNKLNMISYWVFSSIKILETECWSLRIIIKFTFPIKYLNRPATLHAFSAVHWGKTTSFVRSAVCPQIKQGQRSFSYGIVRNSTTVYRRRKYNAQIDGPSISNSCKFYFIGSVAAILMSQNNWFERSTDDSNMNFENGVIIVSDAESDGRFRGNR